MQDITETTVDTDELRGLTRWLDTYDRQIVETAADEVEELRKLVRELRHDKQALIAKNVALHQDLHPTAAQLLRGSD